MVWNRTVEEFIGDKTLTGLKLKDPASGLITAVEVAGAFEAIGHKPNTDFLKGQVSTDDIGYIITNPGSTATSIDGVFAAGDVQDSKFRQAVTSAGSGCMAAFEVEWWLQQRQG
jgi:thioredoxin reductase (NADPH)